MNHRKIILFGLMILCACLLNYDSVSKVYADDFSVFLPILHKIGVVDSSVDLSDKIWTGIHLGNTVPVFETGIAPPWPADMLDLIDPRDSDGAWPSVIVVQSNQLYEIRRSDTGACWVDEVVVNPFAEEAFAYVKAAAQNNIPVIVRITPSPGNFLDYDQPDGQKNNHYLVFDKAAAGDHCAFKDEPYKATYRSPLDIALEMLAIQSFNKNEHGFEIFGFVPANEPNLEWYTDRGTGVGWPTPNITEREAWLEMAAYFQKVYEFAHFYKDELDVRVMTPPMAQNLFSEGIDFFNNCDERLVAVPESNQKSIGYDLMKPYYQNYNDGITWHNYWLIGRTAYVHCERGGGHVSYHFPQWLKETIDPLHPPFILEADIASPAQAYNGNPAIPNPILDSKDADIIKTSESIRAFFESEYCVGGSSTHYRANVRIASWLLYDNTKTAEHHWHMGYGFVEPGASWPNAAQRAWFPAWWAEDESGRACAEEIMRYDHFKEDNAIPLAVQVQVVQVEAPSGRYVLLLFVLTVIVATVQQSIVQNSQRS